MLDIIWHTRTATMKLTRLTFFFYGGVIKSDQRNKRHFYKGVNKIRQKENWKSENLGKELWIKRYDQWIFKNGNKKRIWVKIIKWTKPNK